MANTAFTHDHWAFDDCEDEDAVCMLLSTIERPDLAKVVPRPGEEGFVVFYRLTELVEN